MYICIKDYFSYTQRVRDGLSKDKTVVLEYDSQMKITENLLYFTLTLYSLSYSNTLLISLSHKFSYCLSLSIVAANLFKVGNY